MESSPTTFGSVCSGIEAASVALGPLGFAPKWLSEIDPFASAVLAHHYPAVRNLGATNPTGVAYTTKLHNTGSNNAVKFFEERTTCLDANSPPPALVTAMQVRRLTPTECERLQGFPDGYTAIPWRGKPADACPDGPRYKALGNSWAIPVVRWIGRRMAQALQTTT